MLAIPDDPQDLTADWLSSVLDARVTATRLVDSHAGTTGRAVLELDYAGEVDLPSRLFVKLPPADEAQRAFVRSSGMGQREVMFYRQLSTRVPVRVPHCYHADCDDRGEHYIILLEHLEDSGCRFRNASTRYSLDYMRTVLAAFARLHGAFWESPGFGAELGWVQPPLQHDIALPLIERALLQYAATMPPVFSAMGELYLAHTDAIHRLWEQGPATLIHGDVHDGNLFFDGDEPGFLDWALVARGPAMRDVGYFLAGTLAPQHRESHQRELLDYYRSQLQSNGAPAPPLEELWRQYQWHAAFVWVGATVTLAMGDSWQPVNYVQSALRRLHSALESLDTVAAIRAAL